MALSKRSGRPRPWLARFRGPDGHERAKAFRRKVDAERWLASQEVDRLRGQWTDPRLAKTTFAEWVPTYVASRVHLAPSTRAAADSLMRNHVLPYFGPRALGSVTQTDVQAFVSELQAAGLAPSTIRQCYLLASGVFSSALDSDLIARTPCRGIHLPKGEQEEMRFLTTEEVADLAAAIDSRYRSLVLTATYSGARFGELAALQVSRLDLLRGTLTVAQQLTEVRGRTVIRPPKTAASRRQIALPRFLGQVLEEHLGAHPPVDGFVFTSPQGETLRRTNFRRRTFVPAVKASVGEPMRFHDLRHTHVAMLIAQGEHPKVIQARLGHSSIQVTLDLYGHLFEGLDEAAAVRLDATFAANRADQTRTKRHQTVLKLSHQASQNAL
ncbi:MAG: tyrosine-type recombinase/integrase [Acidimicrobiia bacterium]